VPLGGSKGIILTAECKAIVLGRNREIASGSCLNVSRTFCDTCRGPKVPNPDSISGENRTGHQGPNVYANLTPLQDGNEVL